MSNTKEQTILLNVHRYHLTMKPGRPGCAPAKAAPAAPAETAAPPA